MKTTLTYSSLLLCLALISLSGCQTIGGSSDAPEQEASQIATSEQPVELLESQGNYREASKQWLALASQTPDAEIVQRDTYLLRAVSALLQINNTEQAKQILNSVSQQTTPLWLINSAQLQLLLNKPEETLNILFSFSSENLDTTLLEKSLRLQAYAYNRLGNYIEAARQHVILDSILDDAVVQDKNHAELWKNLNQVSLSTLSTAHSATTPGHYRDWLELAILNKQAKQVGGTVQLSEWQRKHPLHPATARFLATLRNIEQSTTATPTKIALLLPLKGRIAEPARAIRDGFLAAYYRQSTRQTNASIQLYNADANNIDTVYQQAVTDGADFIVGPLAKDAVERLSQQTNLSVPTLVLNANDKNAFLNNRLYQFALLPEDEARQVAERVWIEGLKKGIVIYPQSNWGERVGKAFQQHWLSLGGELVDIKAYSLTSQDYAKTVREVLNVDDSKKRFRKLRSVIGGKPQFETRRRQDVDFVFLASFPEQARQIRPQLKFYGASSVPVYATSHIYTGSIDAQRDRDMNDIIFTDMPWTIGNQQTAVKAELSKLWGVRSEKLTRFYAFGLDAYNVISQLQRLQQYPFERFNGATGSLRLDKNLRIVRQLSWAKFRAGKPRLEPVKREPSSYQPDARKAVEPGFSKPKS